MATSMCVGRATPMVGSRVAQVRPPRSVVCNVTEVDFIFLRNDPPPAYLDGSLTGNYGYDPLGLGADADRLAWYQEAEKVNARWAMTATAGVVYCEALGICPNWWESGQAENLPLNLPFNALVAFQALIMGYFEVKRYQGWKETGLSGVKDSFPFDPFQMTSEKVELAEIKNGRLAMVAWLGFVAQAVVVRKGPIACLTAHLADPGGNNIITNVLNISDNIGAASPVVVSVTEDVVAASS